MTVIKRLSETLFVLLCLAACATFAKLDPAVRQRAHALPVLSREDVTGKQYIVLGEITGISCCKRGEYLASLEEAREKMKIEAVRAGADALVNVSCENRTSQWDGGCRNVVECRGDGIRWKSVRQ